MTNNKLVIYTALFGNYDNLIEPIFDDKDIDYICFTNNNTLISKNWKIIYVNEKKDPVRLNRKYKFLPHNYLKKYNISIYIDSHVVLARNPKKLVNLFENSTIVLFEHQYKNNLLNELKLNLQNNKITKLEYFNFLKNNSYFIFFSNDSKIPISQNRVILRHHNDKEVIKIMSSFWETYINSSIKRDQMLLPTIFFKNNFYPTVIKSRYKFLDFFYLRPHKNYKLIIKLKFLIYFRLLELFRRMIYVLFKI